MTKRILRSIQLDKIAAVDRPCQEGAVVTLMKRADDQTDIRKRLEDAIMKQLIVLPMSMPDDSSKSIDFNQALDDVTECESWCNAKEEIRPYVHALKHSLISIMTDPNLDDSTRQTQMRESTGQFLDTVALKYASAMPVIEDQITAKRARDLRLKAVVAKVGMLMAKKRELEKKGYYVGLKHADGSVKHFTCEAGNRRGARSKAQKEHPEHSIFRVHERNVAAKSIPRHRSVGKSWPERARIATRDAKRKKNKDATDRFSRAEQHFRVGDFGSGHKAMREGNASLSWNGGVNKQRGRSGNPRKTQAGPRRGAQSPRSSVTLSRLGPRGTAGGERKLMLGNKPLENINMQQGDEPKVKAKRVEKVLDKLTTVLTKVLGTEIEVRIMKVIGNTAADYIHDFVHSSNPKFKGKSKQERIRMALGAFYGS